MKTKLNSLLKLPCLFTYKIIGIAHPKLVDQVIEIIQHYVPGNYSPNIKSSINENYTSISITIQATSIKQVEDLYEELSKIDIVRIVL